MLNLHVTSYAEFWKIADREQQRSSAAAMTPNDEIDADSMARTVTTTAHGAHCRTSLQA